MAREKRNACRVLARKPERNRPSGGVGIEVDLTEIRRKGKERTDHAQNRDKEAGCDETSVLIRQHVNDQTLAASSQFTRHLVRPHSSHAAGLP